MSKIIRQIKQKKPGLGPFSLLIVLILVAIIWGVGKITFSKKSVDLGKSAQAQCWTVPPAAGVGCSCSNCAVCSGCTCGACDGCSS